MAIIAKFRRTLPSPTAQITGGYIFLLSEGWFQQADQEAFGSPIDGGANSLANGGGDLQIFSDFATTQRLPIEVVSFVTGATPKCQIWLRTETYSPGDSLTIARDNVQTSQPAVNAPFGRNQVFQGEIIRLHMESLPLIDSTGNHSGFVASNVSVIPGAIGNSLDFNGSSSNVLLGGPFLPTGDFTWSAWVNISQFGSFMGIIGNWVSGVTGRSYLGIFGESINWDGYSTSSNTRLGLSANVPIRLTVTRQGSAVDLQINGVKQGSTVTDIGVPDSVNPVYLGALSGGSSNFFNGSMDDVFLSNVWSSPEKLALEQANQSSPDTFGSSGPWQSVGVVQPIVNSSGVFESGDTEVIGIDEQVIASSGVFESGDTVVIGIDEQVIASSGVFQSQDTAIVGVDQPVITSLGIFQSQDTVVIGVDQPVITSSGVFESDSTTVIGVDEQVVASIGTFESQDTQVIGFSNIAINSIGIFESSDTQVFGFDEDVVTSIGTFESGNTQVSGSSDVVIGSSGIFTSSDTITIGFEPLPVVTSEGVFTSIDTVIVGTETQIADIERIVCIPGKLNNCVIRSILKSSILIRGNIRCRN